MSLKCGQKRTFLLSVNGSRIIRDFYGGGTYKLKGNRYEENVLYHFSKPGTVLNYTLKALIELKNDTLIQTSPVDDNGQINKNKYSIEKYVQLK